MDNAELRGSFETMIWDIQDWQNLKHTPELDKLCDDAIDALNALYEAIPRERDEE